VRCARCGNENPVTNRFCGMCGASLLPTPAPAQAGLLSKPPSAAAPATTPFGEVKASSVPRPAAIPPEAAPIISGPSILGLNQPASPRRGSPLSIDPDARPTARDLNYLLEDDEQPKGGAGKIILIVIALALAIGFGYLRWRHQALPWLGSHATKPTTAAQSAEAADSSSAAASSPATAPAPVASQPAATASLNASDTSGAAPSSAGPSPGTASLTTSAANPAGNPTQPGATPAVGAAGGGASSSAATAQPSAASTAGPASPDAASAPTAASQPGSGLPRKARAADPVSEAQRYIYGKGVRQDCDRGLHLLKPAADQANPKAMIEMGALYSAGLCTPRDLPTSYRWFALALRKDPNNQSLQADLQKLWGEMTQPERQLAIRLSQ